MRSFTPPLSKLSIIYIYTVTSIPSNIKFCRPQIRTNFVVQSLSKSFRLSFPVFHVKSTLQSVKYALYSKPPVRNRIRVLRAERDWSQADLAKKLQVSRQTVNAIERERYDPGLQLAFKIAVVFDLPVEEIFFRDEKKIRRPAGIRIY
jgi:putative transcriptional regulator